MNARYLLKLLPAIVMILVVLASIGLASADGLSVTDPVRIRVETTDAGFRCASGVDKYCLGDQNGQFVIEVDQGQLVELTFVWANQTYPEMQEHIIALDGYKLESDKINATNRESTIKFIADKPGTFGFQCTEICVAHGSLQKGSLKVRRGTSVAAPTSSSAPAAASSQPVSIRVETTDAGFRCAAGVNQHCLGDQNGQFVIEAEQGQQVELTFVWANQSYPEMQEHIIALDGYKLETDKINATSRETTIKFIADQPGTFGFQCTEICVAHGYLQKGSLKVTRSAAVGGESGGGTSVILLVPTTLSVTPSSWTTAKDAVTLKAVLQDDKGAPVSKAEVRFYMEREFGGVQGQMLIGSAKTDSKGIASVKFQPTTSAQLQTIVARFEGVGMYAESQETLQIEQMGVPPPAYEQHPIGLESVRSWAQRGVLVIGTTIWSLFAFVLYQAFAISRVRPGEPSGLQRRSSLESTETPLSPRR